MDINEATAKAIAAERSAAGLTIKELSEKSGVPERTLIRMLKNERDIKVTQIAQLAEVFGINPHELIEEAEKFIARAARNEARERESRITDDLIEPRFENLPPQELAASRDMNRNLEAETPDE
ncbi:helix-turn-helix domain-containing protein [Bifidobacterium adolescentis]|uniref:helix-turn-helix domain-containing protein n=1 Tax=Bifidobacterium adolescentis TaxID=1680 RepID=UPI0018974A99|nr:helix-turn-helix transcriptional regulator [Bifidobacterium adolescentis]MDB1503309.1 helix-turn-helix transcriptional regulator [Bifidobacterium adolescentis]